MLSQNLLLKRLLPPFETSECNVFNEAIISWNNWIQMQQVVVAGNFLNSGGYAGNAAGVKLASLQKLTDIRANKPGMNLIHFVALQAEKKDRNLLKMPEQMSVLEEATKTTVDQLRNEVAALDKRINNIGSQIHLPSTPQDIQLQMEEFLQMAHTEVQHLQEDFKVGVNLILSTPILNQQLIKNWIDTNN